MKMDLNGGFQKLFCLVTIYRFCLKMSAKKIFGDLGKKILKQPQSVFYLLTHPGTHSAYSISTRLFPGTHLQFSSRIAIRTL